LTNCDKEVRRITNLFKNTRIKIAFHTQNMFRPYMAIITVPLPKLVHCMVYPTSSVTYECDMS
jgi:hypothetical protein